jgi:hypothetical protein
VKDLMSDMEGIVVTQFLTLNGHKHYMIQPEAKDNHVPHAILAGEVELQVVQSEKLHHANLIEEAQAANKPKGKGGPMERNANVPYKAKINLDNRSQDLEQG